MNDEGKTKAQLRSELSELRRRVAQLQPAGPLAAPVAFRESEQSYRLLAELSHDFIFIVDNDGRVQYVNAAAARELGADPKIMVGRRIEEVFPGKLTERQKRGVRQVVKSGKPLSFEGKASLPDREMWLDTLLVPIRSETGEVNAALGIARNVTERKQAEEALEASRAELSAIFEQAPLLMLLVDAETRVRQANGTAAAFAGRPAAELTGLPVGTALGCLHALDDPRGCGHGLFCGAVDGRWRRAVIFDPGIRPIRA
jgi:PAS domain S-box-containing protein